MASLEASLPSAVAAAAPAQCKSSFYAHLRGQVLVAITVAPQWPREHDVAVPPCEPCELGKVCQCEHLPTIGSPIIVLAKRAESTGNDSACFLKMGVRLAGT